MSSVIIGLMTDKKNDLTQLSEYSKPTEESDEFISEKSRSKIEVFESLETLSQEFQQSQVESSTPTIEESLEPESEPLQEFSLTNPPVETETPTVPTASETLKNVKEFSERISVGKPTVACAYPFSLLITGMLSDSEKEKLLDLLSRENMGIREVDLEPQLEAGRILIPRISEYAGVLIVQALRGAKAKMRLGPSDEIFATDDTRSSREDLITPGPILGQESSESVSTDPHPAEIIPLTSEASLPGLDNFKVLDAITASAALKTTEIEAESSAQYQELLEALQRELKYKAYRKGATAILSFSVMLTPLSLPTHYRLTVIGSAVR